MFEDMRGVMVRYPYVAGPDMTLAQADIYMKECGIRHLPIIEGNQIVGLVSERDLLRYFESDDFKILCLGEIIQHPPFVVGEDEPLHSVLDVMIKNKWGSALIVNEAYHLVGIFTTIDALIILQNLITGESHFKGKPGESIPLKDVVNWN